MSFSPRRTPARGMVINPPRSPDWARSGKAPAETIDWPELSADPWYAQTEDKIVEAIGIAMRQLFPARIAVDKGTFESEYMAHNRRLVTDKGVTMLGENPNRLPTKPLDPTVGVICIDDLNGHLLREHSEKSEGQSINVLWGSPFIVDLPAERLHTDKDNLLVIRIHNSLTNGGLWCLRASAWS